MELTDTYADIASQASRSRAYTRQHLVLITKCEGITNVDRVKVNIVIILVIVVDVPIIASAIVVIKQRW